MLSDFSIVLKKIYFNNGYRLTSICTSSRKSKHAMVGFTQTLRVIPHKQYQLIIIIMITINIFYILLFLDNDRSFTMYNIHCRNDLVTILTIKHLF